MDASSTLSTLYQRFDFVSDININHAALKTIGFTGTEQFEKGLFIEFHCFDGSFEVMFAKLAI